MSLVLYPKVIRISRQFPLDFPYAFGSPKASALFRVENDDFQVDEVLGFQHSGEGEHLCLHIEKRGENTRWVAKLLAEYFDVDEVAIGYCGMKDRRAVTRQWFSVHLPNTPNISAESMIASEIAPSLQVLDACRHHKKLRRGVHRANSFVIRLRQIQVDEDKQSEWEHRLQKIVEQGVPNYFGEQRFGVDGGNLVEADDLLKSQYGTNRQPDSGKKRGRGKRGSPRGGIYLSAARSYLFNLVLAERISQSEWPFMIDVEVDTSEAGANESDVSKTVVDSGPMWGRGRSNVPKSVRNFEQSVLATWQDWTHALEFSGLQQERRPLVLIPEGMTWQWLSSPESGAQTETCQDLVLSFTLPTGTFATSVLRELCLFKRAMPVGGAA